MAALLLTARATPLMYYGEEIGMRTTPPVRKEDVQDPIGKIGWPEEKGRHGERTPMQWDNTKDAGFSSADHPWLAIPPSAAEYNVSDSAFSMFTMFTTFTRSFPSATPDGWPNSYRKTRKLKSSPKATRRIYVT